MINVIKGQILDDFGNSETDRQAQNRKSMGMFANAKPEIFRFARQLRHRMTEAIMNF